MKSHRDDNRSDSIMLSSLKFKSSRERIFKYLVFIILFVLSVIGIVVLWTCFYFERIGIIGIKYDLTNIKEKALYPDLDSSRPRNPYCRMWNCLNLYRCDRNGLNRLAVYVYPLQENIDDFTGKLAAPITKEYFQVLKTVIKSSYYTSNPNEACLFLPSIDLLNYNSVDPTLVNRALSALEYWNYGENHIIFNMVPISIVKLNSSKSINTDRALILGSNFNTWTFRLGFDLSLPVWSPALRYVEVLQIDMDIQRRHLLAVFQLNIMPRAMLLIRDMAVKRPQSVFILQSCGHNESRKRCEATTQHLAYDYPAVLSNATFCLLAHDMHKAQVHLLEAMAMKCIPVIAVDNYILPFEDIIDWSLASIRIRESELSTLVLTLDSVQEEKIMDLRKQVHWLYDTYFKDLSTITLTALAVLEDRIFPHHARDIRHWSISENINQNPLFLPLIAPKAQGFTAVILTYDRIESLFTLVQKLSLVPSLQSILVVWNNQQKSAPHASAFPLILKPLKIVQMPSNKLSNRFYPHVEIETEAILTIDDDIVMLTTDEIDFGFEVWREFPDRIVGFPSRVHSWNNTTNSWHYESEWTNKISMVLTGAAFYHKYWSHLYTNAMPGDIKEWVDDHMNCEDIAMNFLIANITNKPPIKVTPRKKFKCPECTNTEMLSADLNHMRERSACIDRFAHIYGRLPLRSVEFRADPVLYKDNFPEKLKRFNDIGSL